MADSHVPLTRSARKPVPGSKPLGPTDTTETVTVTIKLRRKTPLPDPRSTRLGRDKLARDYGYDSSDITAVADALQRYGLSIQSTNPATRTMRVSGLVPDMERAFGVRLVKYMHPRHGGARFRGRSGTIYVPAEIAGIVEGVFGLDTRPVVKQRKSPRRRVHPRDAGTSWFYPADLAKIYQFPEHTGAGQCVALLEFGGGFFPDDLGQFCSRAGILFPPNVTAVSVDGTPTNAQDGAEGEVMLDVEVVAGVCPGAKIVVYFASFTEQGWIEALDAILADAANAPSVVSISWGDSEDGTSWSNAAIDQINDCLQQAALQGITVCVAAGDDGSDDQVGDGFAHVDFPASSPWVLCVGGTTLLASGGSVQSETAWKDGDGLRADGGGSTGGGVSIVFEPPNWQSAVSVESVNPKVTPGRIVPDVAANASANTGYFTVVDGQPGISGGTSASSPLWAALLARINALLGKNVGFVTPLLYAPSAADATKTRGSLGCRDIISGNNATAAVGGYSAQKGFDAVSGWGAPIGEALLEQLR